MNITAINVDGYPGEQLMEVMVGFIVTNPERMTRKSGQLEASRSLYVRGGVFILSGKKNIPIFVFALSPKTFAMSALFLQTNSGKYY
mmetsp:Transcript_23505/g.33724  ORF Transcript_23505/g.33724 Transcript_23505/m.33724 type:complete len:87 (-) Transcript_23505:23-283(-)